MSLEAWLSRLADVDRSLPVRGSLHREQATSLEQVGTRLLQGVPSELREGWTEALVRAVIAVHENFPENLFADYDALAGHLARGAVGQDDPEGWLRESADLWVALQRLFGMHSAIRFRYVHDFLYGYDWAKWCKRDPGSRGSVGPYDLPFLNSLERRGRELVRSITRGGDDQYPRLDEEDGPRNVFSFSRMPPEEERLLRALVRNGALPLEAWRCGARGRWQEPFAAMRLDMARELDVPTRPGAKPD